MSYPEQVMPLSSSLPPTMLSILKSRLLLWQSGTCQDKVELSFCQKETPKLYQQGAKRFFPIPDFVSCFLNSSSLLRHATDLGVEEFV